MDASSRLARFARLVGAPDDALELDAIGLVLGDWEHADDDRADDGVVAAGRTRLDALAEAVRRRATTGAGPWAAARALTAVLAGEAGFGGSDADYGDPRASFLGEVLIRRSGLPITLCVLYVEVARRLGIAAAGVGLPGHFVVRVDADPVDAAPGEVLVLDPFHGGKALTHADVEALVRRGAGPDAVVDEATLAPTSPRAIVARMLRNLAGVYGRAGDLPRAIEVLARQALVEPGNERLARELAALRERVAAQDDFN